MLFKFGQSEDVPWTVVCRKRKRRKRPKNTPHVTSWEEDLTISIAESKNSTNYGSWTSIDFTDDSGSAASCMPADMVNKSKMEPRLVGPLSAHQHPIPRFAFGKDSSVGAVTEWSLWSC